MEQGGKSAWGNANVHGYVAIYKKVTDNTTSYEYGIIIKDEKDRGIYSVTGTGDNVSYNPLKEAELSRNSVKTSGASISTPSTSIKCTIS